MTSRVKNVASNTVYQLLGKAASVFCTLVGTALVTRRFGESGYGLFTLMTTFAAYFYLVIDFGINAIIIRKITEYKQHLAVYFRNLYTFRFLFSIIVFLAVIAFLPLIGFKTRDVSLVRLGIAVSLLTVISQSFYVSANAIFQKFSRYDLSNIALTIGNIVALILTVAFLYFGLSLLWVVGATVIGAVCVAGISFYLVRPFVGSLKPAFETRTWGEFLKPSLPVGLGLISMIIMAKADMFLLSILNLPGALGYNNDQALGLYGLAYKVFENALVFPTFFINALYPLLVEDSFSDRVRLKLMVKKAGLFLFGFGLIGAAVGIVLAPFIIKLLGGPAFAGAIRPLQILLASLPVFFPSALFVWLLVVLGRSRVIPLIYLAGSILNISLNLLFIPRFGISAAALITGLTEIFVTLITAYLSLKILFKKIVN